MRRFLMFLTLGLSLVVGIRLAGATPATVEDGRCGMFDTNGTCVCAARTIVTQPFSPGALFGTGPWILHCEGDLGHPYPGGLRYEDNCYVVPAPGVQITGRLFVNITPSGRTMVDCLVRL